MKNCSWFWLIFCLIIHPPLHAQTENGADAEVASSLKLAKARLNQAAPSAIIVLKDGECPACNKRFAKILETYTGNRNIFIIVKAKKQNIDLSYFVTHQASNVCLDESNNLTAKGNWSASKVILIGKDWKIDSVIGLLPKNEDALIELLKTRSKRK